MQTRARTYTIHSTRRLFFSNRRMNPAGTIVSRSPNNERRRELPPVTKRFLVKRDGGSAHLYGDSKE